MIFEGIPFFDLDGAEFLTTEQLLFLGGASGGKAVEDTASGNPVTFLTDLAKPLRQLKANFLPIQSGTGDPSPTNIRPITGWTGLNLFHAGANLIDDTKKYQHSTTTVYIGANDNGRDIFLKAGKYTVTRDFGGKTIGLYYVKRESTTEKTIFNASATETTKTITIAEDGYYGIFCYRSGASGGVSVSDIVSVMFQYGETATAYEPYTAPTSYPVTWQTHGTIYGGYVDLVTGEVWATYGEFVADGQDESWGSNEVGGKQRFSLQKNYLGDTKNSGNCICEWLKQSSSEAWGGWIGSTGNFLCFTPLGEFADVDEWKAYLAENNLKIVFELASPVLITTLTPTQITALIGNNTVWSDANGDCSVTFLKKL